MYDLGGKVHLVLELIKELLMMICVAMFTSFVLSQENIKEIKDCELELKST